MTSRGCTGRDGGSWACSLCSPCGSAACGTPGDPWPRQPSRSASSFSKCMLQMFPLLQTFHWTDGTLVLFNLWGILAFPVFVPLSSYLLSTSLRASVLLASACLFLGSTVRCRTKRKLSPCVGVTPSHASSLQMSPALDPLPGRVRGAGSPGRRPQRHRGAHRHVSTHHGQWAVELETNLREV